MCPWKVMSIIGEYSFNPNVLLTLRHMVMCRVAKKVVRNTSVLLM